jgi:hypothetical protein
VTEKAGGLRAIKLAEVRQGRLTPQAAEIWAKDHGLEPFERKPFVPPAEAMALEMWTAPMTAAWFIWRSPDAVRDQWDKARLGCRIWERVRTGGRPGGPRRSVPWRLKDLGPATIADVFSQAGFAEEITRSSPIRRGVALGAHSTENNPYDRMRLVLERGWLQATRRATGEADEREEAIPPSHWKALFRHMTNIQRIPASSGGAGSETVQRRSHEEAGEILFSRAQVIDAETRISREEFDWRIWTIAQILGWLAYRTESKFRSLDEADLHGRTYRGLRYAQDFENDNLEVRLVDILLGSRITGRWKDQEVGIAEFVTMKSVWDISEVNFQRDVFIKDPIANRVRDQKGGLFGNRAGANASVTTDRPLAPSRPAKVGRPWGERLKVQERMQSDMKSGALTRDKLIAWRPYNLSKHYKASRDTVKAAGRPSLSCRKL